MTAEPELVKSRQRWALLTGGIILILTLGGSFERLGQMVEDAFSRFTAYPEAGPQVVVLGIADSTLEHYDDWPWARSRHARLIEFASAAGARAICYDVFFSQPTNAADDKALAAAIAESGKVILPVFSPTPPEHVEDERVATELTRSLPAIEDVAAGIGHINVFPDSDGRLRCLPAAIRAGTNVIVPTFEAAVRTGATNADDIKSPPVGALINYYGAERVVETYPVEELLEGRLHPRLLKDKIVFVGQTTHGLKNADLVSTPFGRLYGVEVLAVAAENVLNGDWRVRQGRGSTVLSLILMTVALAWLNGYLPSKALLVAHLVAALALALVAVVGYLQFGVALSIVPFVALLGGNFGVCVTHSFRHFRARAETRDEQFATIQQASALAEEALAPDRLPDELARNFAHTIGVEAVVVSTIDNGVVKRAAMLNPKQLSVDLLDAAAVSIIAESARILTLADLDVAAGPDVQQLIAVPLQANQRTIGAVTLVNKIPTAVCPSRSFNSDALELLSITARQAAMNLENCRLIVELQDTLKALREAQSEMVRMEKLSAVGGMASMIVHDAINPISCIRGYASLIKMMPEDREDVLENAQIIVDQTDRATSMLREIIDFTKGELKLEIKQVTVAALVEDVTRTFGEIVRSRNVQLEVDLQYAGPVKLDAERMLRVLANLVKNATEAMIGKRGTTIVVSSCRIGDQVRLAVKDDGPGIPEEYQARLFEAFVTHGKKHGTGLGLAIVKQIVETHGGTIAVSSQVNVGTEFTIMLPVEGPAGGSSKDLS